MFILEIPNNPTYRITGSLDEIMESLASEFISANRATDGYEAYLEAVWTTDPSELDDGQAAPEPVEITEDTVLAFAAKVWDTHQAQLVEDAQPLTSGEFQATQHHLGLSNAEMAKQLQVDARRLSRWIAGTYPIPAGVTTELDEMCSQHDADVEKIVEKADRGIPIIYPGDSSEQETDWAFGWERRVVQRAMIEHGITPIHAGEYAPAVD